MREVIVSGTTLVLGTQILYGTFFLYLSSITLPPCPGKDPVIRPASSVPVNPQSSTAKDCSNQN